MARIAVSAALQDIFGNALAGLGGLYVQLCGYGSQIPRVAGTALLAQTSPLELPVAGGQVNFSVFGNDAITPAGTYYTVQAVDANGNVIQTSAYQFTGAAAVDLSSAAIYYPDGVSQPSAFQELVIVPYAANVIFPPTNLSAVAYKLLLTGNVATATFLQTFPGQLVSIAIEQDSVGGRIFNFPANVLSPVTPSTAPNNKTTQLFVTLDDGLLYPLAGGSGGGSGTATINVGTTTTGAAGTPAQVTNAGTPSAAVLNFVVPQGLQGAPGNNGTNGTNGTNGAAATVAVGVTATGVPGTSAAVANAGTSSAAVLNFTIPAGAMGANGTNGEAASISIGSVTTVPSGTSASVTNVGTPSAAVLNFTIPAGSPYTLPTATAAGQLLVSSGAGTTYAPRALVSADVPNNAANTTGTAANVTGTVAIANGGTGGTTAAAALTALGALAANGITTSFGAYPFLNLNNGSISGRTATFEGNVGGGFNVTISTTTWSPANPIGNSSSGALQVTGGISVDQIFASSYISAGGQLTGASIFSPGTLQINGASTLAGAVAIGSSGANANLTVNGNLIINGSAITGVALVASSATPVFDGTNGKLLQLTMTQNATSSALANLIPGEQYVFEVTQAAAGSGPYTLAWPSGLINSSPISQAASQRSIQIAVALTSTAAIATGPILYV